MKHSDRFVCSHCHAEWPSRLIEDVSLAGGCAICGERFSTEAPPRPSGVNAIRILNRPVRKTLA